MTATVATAPGLPAAAHANQAWQEFPTWLPPMLVKELRQGLRSRGFVGVFVLLQTVLFFAFFFMAGQGGNLAASGLNVIFWGILAGLLLLVFPLRGLSGISAETDGRRGDLLVLTPVTAWRIVTGKWVSLVAQGALITVSLVPYGVMRYFLGEVDLRSDLTAGGLIFAVGAILIGFTLWVSGWPKVLRILLGVAFVPGFFIGIEQIELSMRFGLRAASGSLLGGIVFSIFNPGLGWKTAFAVALALFEGALFLTFCLNQAARRLAPPAENHAAINRVLALLLLFPILLVDWFGAPGFWLTQFAVSGVAIILICALELTVVAQPLRVQVRQWMDAPAWCRPVGWLLLPGWQSAALFAVSPLACALGIGWICESARNPQFDPYLFPWCLMLGWVALVFPSVFLSFFSRVHQRIPGAGYWIFQGIMGIVSIASANWEINRRSARVLADLNSISRMLPGVSLWRSISWINSYNYHPPGFAFVASGVYGRLPDLTPAILFGQAILVVATVMLYLRQSRPYWTLAQERSAVTSGAPALAKPSEAAP